MSTKDDAMRETFNNLVMQYISPGGSAGRYGNPSKAEAIARDCGIDPSIGISLDTLKTALSAIPEKKNAPLEEWVVPEDSGTTPLNVILYLPFKIKQKGQTQSAGEKQQRLATCNTLLDLCETDILPRLSPEKQAALLTTADEKGFTPFQQAVINGDEALVTRFIGMLKAYAPDKFAEQLTRPTNDGYTPLQSAIGREDRGIVSLVNDTLIEQVGEEKMSMDDYKAQWKHTNKLGYNLAHTAVSTLNQDTIREVFDYMAASMERTDNDTLPSKVRHSAFLNQMQNRMTREDDNYGRAAQGNPYGANIFHAWQRALETLPEPGAITEAELKNALVCYDLICDEFKQRSGNTPVDGQALKMPDTRHGRNTQSPRQTYQELCQEWKTSHNGKDWSGLGNQRGGAWDAVKVQAARR